MVGAFISVSVSPVSGLSQPSRRMLTTDWVMERLPAEAIAMMRWPGRVKTWSLRKVAMLSTPALVRVSANITRPSRTRMPQQYVMTFDALLPSGLIYRSRWQTRNALRQFCLHQILLGDGGAEAVVVVDEFADEFVHSLLENLVHAAVLEPGAHRA